MYVCLCLGITDKEVQQAIAEGAHSLSALRLKLGVGGECGRCRRALREQLHGHGILAASAQGNGQVIGIRERLLEPKRVA
ncbi:(2Fe-2S)-binding protein [Pseudaeromonas sp. ZJS20]|uniref:(2Fe-2S)-binding protein n=1 Tax=Pseudaeromonas aegiceratis TaxID=3153928 RepID=UPI00390C50FC